MSGPMQWNPRTGQMVAAGSASLYAKGEDDSPLGALPSFGVQATEEAEAVVSPQRKKTKTPAPKDIVGLAKARLKEVKQELRRMTALEKECGELERLIAAAENKPRAVLREVKKNAG